MSHVPSFVRASEPNVVPLLDVLLVILIIFMLMVGPRQTVDVQVPVEEGGGGAPLPSVVLSVDPGPSYALNGRSLSRAELVPALPRAFAGHAERVVFVDGAPSVRYQEIITAFDVARGAGARITG